MGPSTRVCRGAPLALALLVAVAACDDDETPRADARGSVAVDTVTADQDRSPTVVDEPAAALSDDVTAALTLCTALRDQANVMTDVANGAVANINAKTPAERFDAILAGFDAATDGVTEFADSIADVDVPAIPERKQLLDDISGGADAALAELADERTRFVEAVGRTVADADVGGRVGQFFNSIEKVNSLVEPPIGGYARVDLQRAFLDQPECRHVVQPFVIDEAG